MQGKSTYTALPGDAQAQAAGANVALAASRGGLAGSLNAAPQFDDLEAAPRGALPSGNRNPINWWQNLSPETQRHWKIGMAVAGGLAVVGAAAGLTVEFWPGNNPSPTPTPTPTPGSPLVATGGGKFSLINDGTVIAPLAEGNFNLTGGEPNNATIANLAAAFTPATAGASIVMQAGNESFVFDASTLYAAYNYTAGSLAEAVSEASAGTQAGNCQGNGTLVITAKGIQAQASNAVAFTIECTEPPAPPVPPAFDVEGQGITADSTDGQETQVLPQVTVVNGNDTLPYNASMPITLTALDASAQNCTVNSDVGPIVVTAADPAANLTAQPATEAQFNALIASIIASCYGNVTLAVGPLAAFNGDVQAANQPVSEITNQEPPAPPVPPAPAFDLTGTGFNGTFADRAIAHPLTGVSSVNGNDTLGYAYQIGATFSAIDASAQSCNVSSNGQSVVVTPAAPQATLAVANIATADALVQGLDGTTIACVGNATIATSTQASNGAALSSIIVNEEDHTESPTPPQPTCVTLSAGGIPVSSTAKLNQAIHFAAGMSVSVESGDPSTAVTPSLNYSPTTVFAGCPTGWTSLGGGSCQLSQAIAADQAGSAFSSASMVFKGSLGKTAVVTGAVAQDGCPTNNFGTIATVKGVALNEMAEPAL